MTVRTPGAAYACLHSGAVDKGVDYDGVPGIGKW